MENKATIHVVEEEKPNYYAIIPAEVRYDKELKDKAKLLYGEITALSNKDGYCFASNRYFANLYGVSVTTISILIKNLSDRGYITTKIIYKEGTQEILNRYLKILKYPYLKKLKEGIKENLKENITSINNTSINNIPPITPLEKNNRFSKPTIEEISQYCEERDNGIDGEEFYDFYESKGWMVGKNKMKDWKACIRTWERARKNGSRKTKQQLLDEEMDKWVKEGDEKDDKK